RYYTPELKEMEQKILGADDKAKALEFNLFDEVRKTVLQKSAEIQQSAAAIAALDVLAGFAELARHQNYCRPVVSDGNRIEITDGRHPRSEEHTSELQSRGHLVCRLLLETKKEINTINSNK